MVLEKEDANTIYWLIKQKGFFYPSEEENVFYRCGNELNKIREIKVNEQCRYTVFGKIIVPCEILISLDSGLVVKLPLDTI